MILLKLLPITSLIWCQFKVGSENTLDIMTWNLEWFPKQGNETVDYVDSLIRSSNLDIIALQEITSTPDFNQLIDKMNDSDSLNQWIGFRAADGNWQELAYIINTSSVNIINTPYSILNEYDHYFAYRNPYVVKISYMNDDFFIINNHFKCCGDGIIQNDSWDEEYRRRQASIYIKNYIDTYLSGQNVIVLGDLNDELTDPEGNNVFWNFLSDPEEYLFVDMEIAQGSPEYFSYPTYGTSGSHIDHILVTNELFDNIGSINTILYETELINGWYDYEYYLSDHRPVNVSLCMDAVDECGKCGGDNSCLDCAGTPNGDAVEDCAGDCDGSAEVDECGNCGDTVNCDLEFNTARPQSYAMVNAYPNPFNSNTSITLQNMGNTIVKVDIINVNGHRIDSIYSGYLSGLNTHTFLWDGTTNNSGIYFARILQNNKIIIHKIILLK